MSMKVIFSKAASTNKAKEVLSLACTSRYEPHNPNPAKKHINTGIMMVVANIRDTTRNLKGLVADTSIASICSVTFIEPSSAPICEPTLPAHISAVTSGARARIMAIETNEGSQLAAPNSDNEGLDCFVNTMPVMNAVMHISDSDL